MNIPQKAIDLILEEEGIDQPSRWPGGGSGITLGYGCDIGADPASLEYWRGILTDAEIATLAPARGLTGRAAAQIRTRFAGIHVTREQALKVFLERNLPPEIALTLHAFPGIELLPPEVLGAMVSLVFNRGAAFSDSPGDPNHDRRREMRAIRDLIAAHAKTPMPPNTVLAAIAGQFRAMKRLWIGKGLDGLLARRDAEAALVESAIPA